MQYHGDAVPQGLQVVVTDIHAAHRHAAAGHIIQPGDELHQAALGGAGAADDADRLPGGDDKVDIIEDGFIGAFGIAEADIGKADAAVLDLVNGVFAVGDVAFLLQHLHDALGGGTGHGDHDKDHRKHHQAGKDLHDIGEKLIRLPVDMVPMTICLAPSHETRIIQT